MSEFTKEVRENLKDHTDVIPKWLVSELLTIIEQAEEREEELEVLKSHPVVQWVIGVDEWLGYIHREHNRQLEQNE